MRYKRRQCRWAGQMLRLILFNGSLKQLNVSLDKHLFHPMHKGLPQLWILRFT